MGGLFCYITDRIQTMNENETLSETDSKELSTCDLYLAAFFMSAGCKLVSSFRNKRNGRVYFAFERNPIIHELQMNYHSREAKVPAATYADNIKGLKSLCHTISTTGE